MVARSLKALAFFLILGLSACAPAGSNAPAEGAAAPAPQSLLGAASYYIEFHARQSDVWIGHTYLVYWAQDALGKPLAREVVGFYPGGGYLGMLAAPVAVPGVVGKNDDDERLPDMRVYRRSITAVEYERLMRYVAEARANMHLFNMFTNNCNDFAAGAAKTVGLKIPFNTFARPEAFIADLAKLNDPSVNSEAPQSQLPTGGPIGSTK